MLARPPNTPQVRFFPQGDCPFTHGAWIATEPYDERVALPGALPAARCPAQVGVSRRPGARRIRVEPAPRTGHGRRSRSGSVPMSVPSRAQPAHSRRSVRYARAAMGGIRDV